MNKTKTFFTMVFVGAAASSASALDLAGSDTLEVMTQEVLAHCPAAAGLVYVGGGSGVGETALVNNFNGAAGALQEVAPMSRFFNATVCGVAGMKATAAS